MKHIPIYLDKQLFGELRDRDLMPVQSQGVVRRPTSPRASRREKWRIEEFDQLELRKLRITGVSPGRAAAMLGLPDPATGQSLPCRACRTRELVKRTRTEKMPAQSRGGVKPEP